MLEFNAGSFADIAHTETGRDLWSYLNSEKAIACLETTTYLGRPALEGLQPHLQQRFNGHLTADRWKQMVGRMVRQIMEARGYVLDRSGVLTRVGTLFKSASRYKRPEQ